MRNDRSRKHPQCRTARCRYDWFYLLPQISPLSVPDARYLPACAKRVGVFVNESKENILMYTDRFGLTTSSCMAMKLPSTAVPCAMQACTSSSFLYLAAQGPAFRICLQWSVRLLPLRHQDPAVRRFRQPVRLEPAAPLQRNDAFSAQRWNQLQR